MPDAPHYPEPLCRVCAGTVTEFFDFGRQPLSDAFLSPRTVIGDERFFRLVIGCCGACGMVQLTEEVPRAEMFHEGYPYYSSGSAVMRTHFESTAKYFLATELVGPDPFAVEIGCNDGVMLSTLADAGVRHLGVEPSGGVAEVAASRGVRVRKCFFERSVAAEIRESDGPADLVFAANTLCHVPYVDSVLEGVAGLLSPNGVFVFEDPYLGDVLQRTSFDQIYDEHFYLFAVGSVSTMAARFGLELVDAQRLPVHGGEMRYTLARAGARRPTQAVAEFAAQEEAAGLTDPAVLSGFADRVRRNRDDLVALLRQLQAEGRRVVGYGATAKSATVTNFCGIGPELVEFVCDSTPAKQGRLSPGTHLPVRPPQAFSDPYPDYALLFAWNHAEEIMAKEQAFVESGGRWITYVPTVRMG